MARSEIGQSQAAHPGEAQQSSAAAAAAGTLPAQNAGNPGVQQFNDLLTSVEGAAANPSSERDAMARKLAIFLGIMQGDNYGVPQDTPPPPGTEHIFGVSNAARAGALEDPLAQAIDKATASQANSIVAPANGGTIQSGSFAHDLLASLNLPLTFSNVQAINAWMKAETGSQGKGTPAYNPLATTQKYGQFTTFNSIGVKNYADYNTGVMATANVLMNGKYQGIIDALARGTSAMDVARAINTSVWRSGKPGSPSGYVVGILGG